MDDRVDENNNRIRYTWDTTGKNREKFIILDNGEPIEEFDNPTDCWNRLDELSNSTPLISQEKYLADKAVWLEIYKAVIIRDVHQTKVVRITDEYFDAYKERWAE